MTAQPKSSQLARQAFDLWQDGRAAEAVPLYEQALALAEPEDYALGQYHGEFAEVLAGLGRLEEAERQWVLAVEAERRLAGNESAPGVAVARYFLAEHFLRQNRLEEALAIIEPSLSVSSPQEWLLRYVKAAVLHALGRNEEARTEAAQAIAGAPDEAKRQELKARLEGELSIGG